MSATAAPARPYVTVGPHPRSGWQVAARCGSCIQHTRLQAPLARPEDARAEAQAMYPSALVWMAGDTPRPWD